MICKDSIKEHFEVFQSNKCSLVKAKDTVGSAHVYVSMSSTSVCVCVCVRNKNRCLYLVFIARWICKSFHQISELGKVSLHLIKVRCCESFPDVLTYIDPEEKCASRGMCVCVGSCARLNQSVLTKMSVYIWLQGGQWLKMKQEVQWRILCQYSHKDHKVNSSIWPRALHYRYTCSISSQCKRLITHHQSSGGLSVHFNHLDMLKRKKDTVSTGMLKRRIFRLQALAW